VKIGILTQGYVRRDTSPQQRIADVVEQARVADEVGLASFAVSEQHFKYPTNSTGPIIAIMSAVAQCTEQITITPASVILPFHHPLPVAEEWAGVDIISKGRLYFGTGKGNTPLTADVFKVPLRETDARFDEALEVIVKAWTTDKFSYSGKYYDFPEVSLCPRPFRQPHPPIAFSGLTPGAGRYAGSRKLGLMTGSVANSWQELEAVLAAYEEAWATGTPFDGAVPDKTKSFLAHGHVGGNLEKVREQVAEGVISYINRYIEYKRTWFARAGNPQPEYGADLLNNFDVAVNELPTVFGTPDQCIERLLKFDAMGIDRVDITIDYAPQDELLKCIRLLGREVAPALKQHSRRVACEPMSV